MVALSRRVVTALTLGCGLSAMLTITQPGWAVTEGRNPWERCHALSDIGLNQGPSWEATTVNQRPRNLKHGQGN